MGPATAVRLRALGITTVGQLAAAPVGTIERQVGRAAGRHLHDLALGIDPRPVEPCRAAKSIGHEETYAQDRRDRDGLHRELVRMADAVGSRLRRAGVTGRTVQLKVRFADFTTITRARTQPRPVSTGPGIEQVASSLLDGVDVGSGIRLLGVSVSSLSAAGADPAEQLALGFGPGDAQLPAAGTGRPDPEAGPDQPASSDRPAPLSAARPAPLSSARPGPAARSGPAPWLAATKAIDDVRARYGEAAVGPAALLGPDGLRIGRPSGDRWGPASEAVPDGEK